MPLIRENNTSSDSKLNKTTAPESMKPKKEIFRGRLRRPFRVFGIVILASLFLLALSCPTCLQMPLKQNLLNFLFSAVMFVSLWLANGYLADVLDNYMPWLQNIGKRFWVSIISTLVVTIPVVLIINVIYWSIKGYSFFEIGVGYMGSMVVTPIVITFLISLFMHSRSFLIGWRQMSINMERYQKESIASQYESLKAQVNPHFLFNSLNVLTSLVETDQKQAVKFIRKLSEVYRYVLDSRQMEVASLADELTFLDSYMYLQKIRHGEALQIENDIPKQTGLMVVPLAMQMLLENAVKHNAILEEEPLHIRLYLEGDYIVVQNGLQERRIKEESTGVGLHNIEARYSYLTNKPVQVIRSDKLFTVMLPALHIKA